MSWFDRLQQASFRGVPFGVLTGDSTFGRRVALHEYPFRDKPWPEDLGRGTRKIALTGFLLESDLVYGGGDVISQRDAMVGACEASGSGTLVHPTLGNLNVSLLEVAIQERWQDGRYFELSFSFVESGEREFPTTGSDTSEAVGTAANDLDGASALNFSSRVSPALSLGGPVARTLSAVMQGWSGRLQQSAFDATGLVSMVSGLPGESFGRYFGGHRKGFDGALTSLGSPTVADLIVAGSDARASVSESIASLSASVESGDADDIATGAQASVAALVSALPDPADAVRLTASLSSYVAEPIVGTTALAMARQATSDATAALARRASLAGLARAAVSYQPWSADDAAALRDRMCALFDAEILTAGDAGDDESYAALRALRAQSVADLDARGAALPPLKRFSFAASLPALTLANRLYRDAARADELIVEAAPRHPAFMPISISVLAG